MHQAQCAGNIGIGKLFVEIRDLRREQQALVNNGAARERGNVEHLRIFYTGRRHLTLGAFAYYIELSLKGIFVGECAAAYKNLLDVGLRGSCHPANRGSEDRSIAPAQYSQSLLADNTFQNS